MVHVRSKEKPNLYWYAFHQSLPVLSKISKTLWDFESPSLPFYPESLGIKVEETPDAQAVGQYICILDSQEVRMCTRTNDNGCKCIIFL